MLGQDLVNLINLEADELLDQDTDNIPYINAAMDYLSFMLKDYIASLTVTDNFPIPSNFIALSPVNGYPVWIENDQVFKTSAGSVNVRYIAARPHITALADTIPFRDMYASVLTFIASYMIKKKSYIPVEYTGQDGAFVKDVIAAIAAAKGG